VDGDVPATAAGASGAGEAHPRSAAEQSPLHGAAERCDVASVEELLGRGADVSATDSSGRTALHVAAARGHGSVVDRLLPAFEASADLLNALDGAGRTALHLTALHGHGWVARKLLACRGVDVNKVEVRGVGGDAIVLCTSLDAGHAATELLVGVCGTALHDAAWHGQVSVVEALLACARVDVNAKDASGRTALEVAASEGRASVVEASLTHSRLL
jgi:ankyrin repeat protein